MTEKTMGGKIFIFCIKLPRVQETGSRAKTIKRLDMKCLYDALSYYMGIVVITLKIIHFVLTKKPHQKKIKANVPPVHFDPYCNAYKLRL